jgi:anaerobic magnesium-protoporphyrin IX monomethyl ester cyclase
LDRQLPGQAWDLLDMTRYRAHNWHCFGHLEARAPYASLQTSLGCPFTCSFCCINSPFGTPMLRTWSPDNVIAQIDRLVRDYGVSNIKIPDEMFVLNRRHVIGICDRIIERGYRLNIWAYARVDTVQDEVLAKLARAGFTWLGLGIESGSQHVRDGVEKGRFGRTGHCGDGRQDPLVRHSCGGQLYLRPARRHDGEYARDLGLGPHAEYGMGQLLLRDGLPWLTAL